MKITIEDMAARYWEVTEARAEILAALEPLQAELQAVVASNADSPELRAQIKEVREPLYDLDMERAMLARALNGKVDLSVKA